MTPSQTQKAPSRQKRVLNVGAGAPGPSRFNSVFGNDRWTQVRLDIDPETRPDIVGSAVDLRGACADASFEAVWSSHQLEHLAEHEVIPCLSEMRRILTPNGFALVTCPDIQAIAAEIAKGNLEEPVYLSPAGPIRPIDMLYGHAHSLAHGRSHMGHRTGFSAERLGRLALAAGFHEVRVRAVPPYDLWGLLLMPEASVRGIARGLSRTFLTGVFDPIA